MHCSKGLGLICFTVYSYSQRKLQFEKNRVIDFIIPASSKPVKVSTHLALHVGDGCKVIACMDDF